MGTSEYQPMNNRRSAIMKVTALILLIAFGIGLHYAYELLTTGVSYKAKVLCSDVFISQRSPQSVLSGDLEVEDLAPLRFIDTQVDLAGQQVLASFLGVIRQKAVYRVESGCTLVFADNDIVASAYARGLQAYSVIPAGMLESSHKDVNPPIDTDLRLSTSASGTLPSMALDSYGTSALTADMPHNPDTRFDAALDWAFAEPDSKHLRRTRAVVIVKDGKIVAERYAPGFSANTPLPGWSMAKSVMNALVGILVGEGRLDLDAPAWVPEWHEPSPLAPLPQGEGSEDDPRREITLGQLMHMVSGLEFSESAREPLGDVTRMLMREPDAAAYAASKPLAAKPGTLWHYASGTTNIISRIIRHHLGEAEYREFPRRALFAPLGMDSARLETDASGIFHRLVLPVCDGAGLGETRPVLSARRRLAG